MSEILVERFAAECRRELEASDAPAARARVAGLLAERLRDPAFVNTLFAGPVPERKIVHEDPQLGFCILVHEYHAAREGGVHDHGPSWAIYGQAAGESVMSEYELVEPAQDGRPGRARKLRDHAMRPGDARVYNEGDIHAASHRGPSKLVRIEGTDLANVKRGWYEAV
jgi:hypothetical protein